MTRLGEQSENLSKEFFLEISVSNYFHYRNWAVVPVK